MCGLTLGFFGVVCCFIGMECTYIGGGTKTKDKFLLAGSVFHFIGGKDGSCLLRSTHNLNCLRCFVIKEQMCFSEQACLTSLATACTSTEWRGTLLIWIYNQEPWGMYSTSAGRPLAGTKAEHITPARWRTGGCCPLCCVFCVILFDDLTYCNLYCRYDLGNPIFLGLVGSFLILFGAILYAITVFRVVCPKRYSTTHLCLDHIVNILFSIHSFITH